MEKVNQNSKSCALPIQYDPEKPMQVGGQAVMEGVMMRAPGAVATAVRKPNGEIVVKRDEYRSVIEKYSWLNVAIVRGAVGLVDMMILGIRTLNWSAEVAMAEEKKEKATETKKESKFSIYFTVAVALVLGVGIFFGLPILLTSYLFDVDKTALSFNLFSGAIRITLFMIYLLSISQLPDVFRLFQYHGAEHKSIFAFEEQQSVDLATARTYTTLHPRCGTSFLLIVMVVSILSFAVLDSILLSFMEELSVYKRLLIHLPFIPVVGGLSYEVVKFSAKHTDTFWGRLLVKPGLWLQLITTKEPDDSQLEVALVALKSALGMKPESIELDEEKNYERVVEKAA